MGGYNQEFDTSEDYDFFSRAAEKCRFMCLPEPLYGYRDHPGQISGLSHKGDQRFEVMVVSRMWKRYGYARLFPDLYAPTGPASEAAAALRLAWVFHERGGFAERDEQFGVALKRLRERETRSPAVAAETVKLLYIVGQGEARTYRDYSRACASAWPSRPAFWKHVILSHLLPPALLRRWRRAARWIRAWS